MTPIGIPSPFESIDLTSPPSSPVPSTVQQTSSTVDLKFTRIPEQNEANRNAAAYKVNNV
ncbi:MAG: hypothetical protein ACRYE7_00270 [Janthinobacterium lividum]